MTFGIFSYLFEPFLVFPTLSAHHILGYLSFVQISSALLSHRIHPLTLTTIVVPYSHKFRHSSCHTISGLIFFFRYFPYSSYYYFLLRIFSSGRIKRMANERVFLYRLSISSKKFNIKIKFGVYAITVTESNCEHDASFAVRLRMHCINIIFRLTWIKFYFSSVTEFSSSRRRTYIYIYSCTTYIYF